MAPPWLAEGIQRHTLDFVRRGDFRDTAYTGHLRRVPAAHAAQQQAAAAGGDGGDAGEGGGDDDDGDDDDASNAPVPGPPAALAGVADAREGLPRPKSIGPLKRMAKARVWGSWEVRLFVFCPLLRHRKTRTSPSPRTGSCCIWNASRELHVVWGVVVCVCV